MKPSKNSNILKTSINNNGIFKIVLDNSTNHNVLSEEMMQNLQFALDEAASNNKIRVIIISANGSTFSAGHDLKELKKNRQNTDKGKNYYKEIMLKCSKLMMSIVNNPKPVIAEVSGVATAAGCQLVASCDLSYASKSAKFATPGVNIGLFCSTPMVALSRNVNKKDALKMLLTGDMINADEAKRISLINEHVPENELTQSVMELATKISQKSSITIKTGKQAFYQQYGMDLNDAYEFTSKTMTENALRDDAKEGINAFIEKRDPDWSDN